MWFCIDDGRQWKAYDERCALAFAGAFRMNRPAMQPYKLLDDGKPQAEAPMLPRQR